MSDRDSENRIAALPVLLVSQKGEKSNQVIYKEILDDTGWPNIEIQDSEYSRSVEFIPDNEEEDAMGYIIRIVREEDYAVIACFREMYIDEETEEEQYGESLSCDAADGYRARIISAKGEVVVKEGALCRCFGCGNTVTFGNGGPMAYCPHCGLKQLWDKASSKEGDTGQNDY